MEEIYVQTISDGRSSRNACNRTFVIRMQQKTQTDTAKQTETQTVTESSTESESSSETAKETQAKSSTKETAKRKQKVRLQRERSTSEKTGKHRLTRKCRIGKRDKAEHRKQRNSELFGGTYRDRDAGRAEHGSGSVAFR